jgi:hypothetical protein
MIAYEYLERLRAGEDNAHNRGAVFEEHMDDLGYGLLLKAYTDNPAEATEEQIQMAVKDSIPEVAPLFWSFRVMVAAGFWMLLLFLLGFYYNAKRARFRTSAGCCGPSCSASRCPGSPPRPAGSSPSSAASPGPSVRCCRPPSPPPA